MTMRDDIARIIFRSGQSCDFQQDTIFAADAIMHSLPELIAHSARIAELEKELGHCIYELNRADSRKPHRDRRAGWSAAHDAHVAAFLAAYLAERKKQKEKDK